MPIRYKQVYNGCTIVRRKVETKMGKQAIVTPDKDEKEAGNATKGSGVAEPVLDKKALQAKLRAELFK